MSNDHLNYKRPEITRSFETLAKDQREIIDEQKKKNEFKQKLKNMDLFGLINSKIYSYAELSVDNCIQKCSKKNNSDHDSLSVSNKHVFSFHLYIVEKKFMKEEINMKCFDNCVNKNMESFRMLLNYFFAKMKHDRIKKDDVHSLYEIPDKFKNKNF